MSGSLANVALTSPNNAGYTLPADAVWLITGCSSGLGLSLAQLIAAHPTHRVVATARSPSKIKDALPSSSRVLVVALDVTSPSSITSALATVLEHPEFGRVDVLGKYRSSSVLPRPPSRYLSIFTNNPRLNKVSVNNAGYGLMGDTESSLPYSPAVPNSSDEEHSKARAVVDTDFWGTATMTLHAMRIMREDNARNGGKQGGLVIQISSMGGFMAFPGNAYYHAAKFAVEGFTESVRREVRPEWNSKYLRPPVYHRPEIECSSPLMKRQFTSPSPSLAVSTLITRHLACRLWPNTLPMTPQIARRVCSRPMWTTLKLADLGRGPRPCPRPFMKWRRAASQSH